MSEYKPQHPLFSKLGTDAGLLNYVDHETPRFYFLSALATEEDVYTFAEAIVRECIKACPQEDGRKAIRNRMGVE